MGIIINSVPVGSLMLLPSDKRAQYRSRVFRLPHTAQVMLFSPQTGAFTRGLTKAHSLPGEKSAIVAFGVLRVAIGEVPLAQLTGVLSNELPLPPDKAEAMAKEIEDDLFGPVKGELEAYWRSQKDHVPERRAARNVLNLKEEKKPPVPPPLTHGEKN